MFPFCKIAPIFLLTIKITHLLKIERTSLGKWTHCWCKSPCFFISSTQSYLDSLSISSDENYPAYEFFYSNRQSFSHQPKKQSSQSTFLRRADQEAAYLLPNQSHLQTDTSTPYSQTLSVRGVSRVNSAISKDTALEMQHYIDHYLMESIKAVESFLEPRAWRFANVLEKENRWDLLLPFDDDNDVDPIHISTNAEDGERSKSTIVVKCLNEALGEGGTIGPIIEELLGPHAKLYELACLISDSGSNRQEIHPDIVYQPDGKIRLIACFLSLQDIDATMGPTVFIPDTVTEYHHRAINNEDMANEMLSTIPSVISTLDIGDASLYNPMLLHAGGGNVSKNPQRRRRLFYFTFLNPEFDDPSHDFNPGSIRPDLKKRGLDLAGVRESLKTYFKGGGGSQCRSY